MPYNPSMRFAEAREFLLGRRRAGVKLGLRNMERAMDVLGRPHRRLPALLVAGSKGKGSLCAIVEAVLRAAGYRTGLYTSPHLVDIRERIRVNGRSMSAPAFGRLVGKMRSSLGEGGPPLTFFEWLTAMGICHFREKNVDLAIFEVGLGGRLDATNVVPAETAVITSIEREHTGYLGTRLADIAREKGGIIRPGATLVSGVAAPAARRALARLAKERGAQAHWLDDEVSWGVTGHGLRGVRVDLESKEEGHRGLRLALLGRHQARNAALAFLTLRALRARGFTFTGAQLKAGMAGVQWPGRCQYLPGKPAFLLDGAHTPSSALALSATLEELFPRRRRVTLFGALTDKKIGRLAEILFPGSRKVILAPPPEARAPSPGELLGRVPPRWRERCLLSQTVVSALEKASREAGKSGLVVVAGSLFLVGEVLRRLRLPVLP